MRLEGHGIAADLPQGWEGAIAVDRSPDAVALADVGGQLRPTTHLATFGLPAVRGDFGSGAVELMSTSDAFVALVEYEPALAREPLFVAHGLPRRLDPRAFDPGSLQRTIRGQVGLQRFFNEAGRAFCLYVVLGDRDDVHRLTRRVEQALAGVRIGR